jgi:amino acid transporter
LFAGARDGLLPKPLAKVHHRFFTPYIAIAFYTSAGFLLAISGGFKQLATIASASVLIIYLGVVLATIKRSNKNIAATEKTFRVPGGMLVPLLASIGIIWLLCSLSRLELMGIAIFTLVFSSIYLIMKLVKKN